jgi:hypothetical protein
MLLRLPSCSECVGPQPPPGPRSWHRCGPAGLCPECTQPHPGRGAAEEITWAAMQD